VDVNQKEAFAKIISTMKTVCHRLSVKIVPRQKTPTVLPLQRRHFRRYYIHVEKIGCSQLTNRPQLNNSRGKTNQAHDEYC